MALDGCKPLKIESPSQGTQLDFGPTELNPLQDAIEAAGLFVQNTAASVIDKTTLISRTGTNLTFTDANATRVLSELVSATRGQSTYHSSLVDAIHDRADGGPADGVASGAVQTASYNGPLLINTVWWTSSALTQRIFGVAYSYAGPLVATATYTLYDGKGSQARQLVDSFAYSGPLCTTVTRTWS